MSNSRPHVLLTNDDGIRAPGLRALAAALRETADLTIVAPSQENSGMGHAITIFRDLHFAPVHENGQLWGWGLNGTPADCTKVAIHMLGRDRPFDAVISGVNLGQNAGLNVLYSGTVAAAREAAVYGLPAMAVSLLYHDDQHLPYHTAGRVAAEVLALMLKHGTPRGTLLNVNVPPLEYDDLKGWAVTRMGDSGYSDFFELREHAPESAEREKISAKTPTLEALEIEAQFQVKKNPDLPGAVPGRSIQSPALANNGPVTFRNVGAGWNRSTGECADVDDHALFENKVTITPLQFDLTDHAFLPDLAGWFGK